VTHYLYEKGPDVVSAEGSWCMADGFAFTMRFTVNFERATADYEVGREHALTVYSGGRTEYVDLEGDGYSAEIAYLLECIRTGRKPERVSAQDAVIGLRVIEAEQRSVESGQVERL
jgi:predicted dehydrogenase